MTELEDDIGVVDLPKYVEGPWPHVERNFTYDSMGEGRENIYNSLQYTETLDVSG